MDESQLPMASDASNQDNQSVSDWSQPAPAAEEITASDSYEVSWGAILKEVLETLVLTLVIFFLIRTVVQNFRVDGMSMEPNFHDGQFLIINKLTYRLGEPQRGDVVVFRYPRDPDRDFIKRIVGLPGETVEIRRGIVFIDGVEQPELATINEATYNAGPKTLGPDELFVLGDNRPNSSDSHSWGPLSLDLIIGKVTLSYWPPESWGRVTVPATASDSPNAPANN